MKNKLTIDEQIEDLKEKGVVFNIMNEDDAKKFLRYNNYYFKLKSYMRDYPINPKNGKYVNLEFAYLVELSKIDMYLRKIILSMCLDVEHVLKTRMLYDISRNEKEDGYNIVKKYFFGYPDTKAEIIQKANSYNFTSDLADKHVVDEEYSVWNLVELLSFGKFVELYTMYYQEDNSPNYGDYLQSIKFLRNAAAHSNCLLSSIMKPKGEKKFKKTVQLTNALAKAKKEIHEHARVKYMAYPAFHDFVALLFVYNDLLKESANRKMRDRTMSELTYFFCDERGRVLKHREYFTKNQVITEAYKFVSDVIKYIQNQNNNPKHKRFLKI
jgi:abortive infection bacteriophage resistance protein